MAVEKINYKEVLKEKDYRKLLFSIIINRFGDSIDAIAFTWLVYQITQSGSWSAIIFGLNMLPNVILQPFSGAIVEKLNKKTVMILTHCMRGLVLTGFIFLYLSGIRTGWIMAGFTLIITSIEAFNMPAGTAFIPRVIKKEHLTHALSLNATMSNAVALVGTGLAGVIIAKAGIYTAMIIDVATFFIAAFLIFTIKAGGAPEKSEAADVSYMDNMKDGIRYIKDRRVLINYCVICVILNMFLVPINALQAPLVSECFHMGSEMLSFIGMIASFGSVIGSVMIPAIAKKYSIRRIIILSGLILGAGVFILPMGSHIGGAYVWKMIYAGVCFMLMTITSAIMVGIVNINLISNVEQGYLARISSVLTSVSTAAMPIASLLVSWAETRLETATLITLCGVITTCFFVILYMINPQLDMKKGMADGVKIA